MTQANAERRSLSEAVRLSAARSAATGDGDGCWSRGWIRIFAERASADDWSGLLVSWLWSG